MLKSFSNLDRSLAHLLVLQQVNALLRRPDPRILGHFADHAGLRPAWSAYVVGVKRKVLLVYEVGVKIHFSPNTGVGLWAKIPNTSTFVARAWL